ncbi:hypothetical protein BDV95DRAFT_610717 [Massariosphaeria phaeospora]|uniref:Uncharacterized protein n=1 Tax=Massariosphaeria phaeospora TaxID=100035 RepID=A0A7C8M6M6_9PLEO|nr:hypothetical protein BDV95DRAFT_610717 [Massariosphaeria phaeospora]
MVVLSSLAVLLGLFHVYSVAQAAIVTVDLTSDFKKNNASAKWAPGHPVEWRSSADEIMFEWPLQLQYAGRFTGHVTNDAKFLIMANESYAQVVSLDTRKSVSTFALNYLSRGEGRMTSIYVGNGYDVIISGVDYTINPATEATVTFRLSANGTIAGPQTVLPGSFTNVDKELLHRKSRFVLTNNEGKNVAYVHDLNNPNTTLTLSGHRDAIISAAWAPYGRYIATAAWDGIMKLWDEVTGKELYSFPSTNAQNWLTRFSPDGQYFLYTAGNGDGRGVYIYNMDDLNLTTGAPPPEPWLIKADNWVRSGEFSPQGDYVAFASYGLVEVYRTSDRQLVQRWAAEDKTGFEVTDITWIAGSKRLAFRAYGGLEMYDFETNLKYRWGPGEMDHFDAGVAEGSTFTPLNRGWIGGRESDSTFKFWKYPA